jgi:hypothetical protein
MRRYFEQTGLVLKHRCDPAGKPEAWWLADVDDAPYPMPSHWRARDVPAGQVPAEAEEFPSLARLWRAWATTQHRFAREARCIELIRERMTEAAGAERREVVRWVRSGGMAYPASGGDGVTVLDFDGAAVDETRWPWSAVAWQDGEMIGRGWPWAMVPESSADGLEIQQHPDWAEEALVLYWFDTRYVESYFEGVRVVLSGVLPELSRDGFVQRSDELVAGKEDELGADVGLAVGTKTDTPSVLH